MRIALVAPLYESVPPKRYGGTERVVHYLAEELVRRGHEVTLYATGDSRTSANLRAVCPAPLRSCADSQDLCAYHVLQQGMVYREAEEYDLIHCHAEFRALPFAGLVRTPTISTNHNRLDTPDCLELTRLYPEANLTSLSYSQRNPIPHANWVGNVYNAVPVEEFAFSPWHGSYLVFLGRMSPEKGPETAIEVAKRVGMPLKIAAKVNGFERDYFEQVLRPKMDHPLVEFLGEVDEAEKQDLLSGAYALLFPIRWPEPFGLVMIEAMACGTPVLAFGCGAVPEILEHDTTGFICADVDEMVARCTDVASLDRRACRRRVLARFSVAAMVDGYEAAYRRTLDLEVPRHSGVA